MFNSLFLLAASDSVRHTPGRPTQLSEHLYCPMCGEVYPKKDKWKNSWNPKVHSALANWCHDSFTKSDCMEIQSEVADVGAH